MLYLQDDDSVSAETFINRASLLVTEETDGELRLQHRCAARILDAKRKFLEAGHPLLPALDPRHQVPRRGQAGRRRCAPPTRHTVARPRLSPRLPHTQVDEAEPSPRSRHSITCAASRRRAPQRSRLLGMLYKDERAPKAPSYGILRCGARHHPRPSAVHGGAPRAPPPIAPPRASSLPSRPPPQVYMDRLPHRRPSVAAFADTLAPHQKAPARGRPRRAARPRRPRAQRPLAASRLYNNVRSSARRAPRHRRAGRPSGWRRGCSSRSGSRARSTSEGGIIFATADLARRPRRLDAQVEQLRAPRSPTPRAVRARQAAREASARSARALAVQPVAAASPRMSRSSLREFAGSRMPSSRPVASRVAAA